jgi:hypothetical protein
LSHAHPILSFDFAAPSHAANGSAAVLSSGTAAGEANVIARWIRLELDERTVLEARPEADAVFFSRPHVCPLPEPVRIEPGRDYRIGTAYRGVLLETWLDA